MVALRWGHSNCPQSRCSTQHCTISAPWGVIRLQPVQSPVAATGLQMVAATTLHTPGGVLPWCPFIDSYHLTTEMVSTEPYAYYNGSKTSVSTTASAARIVGKMLRTWRIVRICGRKCERCPLVGMEMPWKYGNTIYFLEHKFWT